MYVRTYSVYNTAIQWYGGTVVRWYGGMWYWYTVSVYVNVVLVSLVYE